MSGMPTGSAVIIAGGRGTRLSSLTGEALPKALMPIAGKPVIFRLLEWLAKNGIKRTALLAGHLAHKLAAPVQQRAQRSPQRYLHKRREKTG